MYNITRPLYRKTKYERYLLLSQILEELEHLGNDRVTSFDYSSLELYQTDNIEGNLIDIRKYSRSKVSIPTKGIWSVYCNRVRVISPVPSPNYERVQ